MSLRKPQIGNNSRLIKSQALRADGKESPDEGEQPEATVAKSVEDLANPEIGLVRSGRIQRQTGLDERFFFLAEPGCVGGNLNISVKYIHAYTSYVYV